MGRLLMDFAVENKNVSHMEQVIAHYISLYPAGDFTEAIKQSNAWEVVYHLSDLRVALLGWYPFCNKDSVLELGAGFGAITEYLCEKAGRVTAVERSAFRARVLAQRCRSKKNLTIYAGDFQRYSFKQKFDYIFLTGKALVDDASATLTCLQGMLKPSGKLLLAVDNCFGLRYLCGEKKNQQEANFSRQSLNSLLEQAGFSQRKFYYPLPDYRLPQVIYSDNHLPGLEMLERITPYYLYKERLHASELELYPEILRNGGFPLIANSFFVECGRRTKCCSIDYAVVTADRGRKDSLVTYLEKNEIFVKKALFSIGNACMDRLHQNMQNMSSNGLKVISYAFQEHVMKMPYIHEQTVADYLRSLGKADLLDVYAVFDRLWKLILHSSEQVDKGNNILLPYAPQADWGPVLKTAYLEMIPMNCFLVEREFAFFDQEFILENCPAKYPMFRALLYSAGYLSHIVSLQELKQRYGLIDLWDVFQVQEEKFHAVLRQHDVYHQFYRWAWADPKQIQNNIMLLDEQHTEESLCAVLEKERYSLYSFDVFDTLITRRTASPKGIFVLMQEKLQKDTYYQMLPDRVRENFLDLRIYYEGKTSQLICQCGIGDISLDEIYDTFAQYEHLTEEQGQMLAELERKIEIENVIGISENIRLLRKLCEAGRRVVLISDMYIDEVTLRRMLSKVDLIFADLPLYISSVYRKRKDTGALYRAVQKCEQIDFFDWLHCGDNHGSDIDAADSLGIRTVCFAGASLQLHEKELLQKHEREKKWQLQIGHMRKIRLQTNDMAAAETSAMPVDYGLAADFPCGILHKKVAIYGAGRYGQDLYRKIWACNDKEVIIWVDRDFDAISRGNLPVKSVEALRTSDFDDIIIAIKNRQTVSDVRKQLTAMGIAACKIIADI